MRKLRREKIAPEDQILALRAELEKVKTERTDFRDEVRRLNGVLEEANRMMRGKAPPAPPRHPSPEATQRLSQLILNGEINEENRTVELGTDLEVQLRYDVRTRCIIATASSMGYVSEGQIDIDGFRDGSTLTFQWPVVAEFRGRG